MKTERRDLAAARLREIADEVGLELSAERCERLLGLLESTVDAAMKSAEPGLEDEPPTITPDPGSDDGHSLSTFEPTP